MKTKKIIVFLFGIFITFCCKAEVKTDELQQLLADRSMFQSNNIQFQKEVRNFYNYFHYKLAWIKPGSSSPLNSLLVSFTSAKNLGLEEKDYQYKFIIDFKNGSVQNHGIGCTVVQQITIIMKKDCLIL